MSSNARTFALGLGLAMLLGGIVIMIASESAAGLPLLLLGLLVIVSVALDKRYRQPGDPAPVVAGDWQPTGERFIDDQTGQPLEVWMDSLTGARRYEPIEGLPPLPEPRP